MGNELSVRDAIRVLTVAMDCFREGIDAEAPAQRILTFLAVAANPDMPQYDVSKHVKGIAEATVSRNVTDLSALNRARQPGPDLVEQRPDPMYRRRNLLRLTPKGERLLEQLASRINDTLGSTRNRQGDEWRCA